VASKRGKPLLPRCQDLPNDAFATKAKAAELYGRRRRDVHVLSYGWRTPGQPDPDGSTLAHVFQHLSSRAATQQTNAENRLLFIDWSSLPQKDTLGRRSPQDGEKFGRALDQMGSLYASLAATAVLQLQNVAESSENLALSSVLVVSIPAGQLNPARADYILKTLEKGGAPSAVLAHWATIELPVDSQPKAEDVVSELKMEQLPGSVTPRTAPSGVGWSVIFDVRRCFLELLEALPTKKSLKGTALEGLKAELRLRFETADGAQRALDAIEGANLAEILSASYLLYNKRPYAERGWPTFETGAACLASAHLKHEAQRDQGMAQRFETDFTHAERTFDKLHVISDGEFPSIVPNDVMGSGPEDVQRHIADRLQNVFFTGKGDKDTVIKLLDRYDKKMRHALQTAQDVSRADALGTTVEELQQERQARGRATASSESVPVHDRVKTDI